MIKAFFSFSWKSWSHSRNNELLLLLCINNIQQFWAGYCQRNYLIIKALSANSLFLSFYIYMGEILTDHREKKAGPHKVRQCHWWIVWKGITWCIYGIHCRIIRTAHSAKRLEINGFYRFSCRYIFCFLTGKVWKKNIYF